MATVGKTPKSIWQFGLPALLLTVTFCALASLLWRLGGAAGLLRALITGILLGIPITFLGKNKVVILSAAVAGAVVTMILGFCLVDIDVNVLNNPTILGQPPNEIEKHSYDHMLIWWWPIPGALLGPALAGLGMLANKSLHLTRPAGGADTGSAAQPSRPRE